MKINARLIVNRENRLFVVFRRVECFFLLLLAEHFGQVLEKIDRRFTDRHIEQMIISDGDQALLGRIAGRTLIVVLLMDRLAPTLISDEQISKLIFVIERKDEPHTDQF